MLVVMGHALEHNGYNQSPIFDLIYSFHMPLFFCISGFVTMYACELDRRSKPSDYGKYIWRKFLAIMLPFFVWSLVVKPFFFAHSFLDVKRALSGAFSSLANNTGLWFLPCLFILLVIFTIWIMIVNRVNRPKQKSPFIETSMILIAGGGLIILSQSIDYFRSASNYVIPFFVGVMMGRYTTLYDLIVRNKSVFTISLVLFCLESGYFENISGFVNRIIRLTTGLLALPVFFHLFEQSSYNTIVNKGLAVLGKNTLIIYVLNYSFVKGIPIPNEMGIWSQLLVFFIIAVVYSFSFALVGMLLEKSTFLAFCLLGKRPRTSIDNIVTLR